MTLSWTAPEGCVNFYVLRNGVQIAETTETTYVDSGLKSGLYTYSVIANYEEGQSIPRIIVVEIYDNVGENAEVMFTVYPNPAKDYVNIVSNAQSFEYQIINSLGQVVLSGNSNAGSQVSLSEINNGVYFLRVYADGNISIQKLVVE